MPISFVAEEVQHLYEDYEYIATHFPGFALAEIKGMSPRERKWWMATASWRIELKNPG